MHINFKYTMKMDLAITRWFRGHLLNGAPNSFFYDLYLALMLLCKSQTRAFPSVVSVDIALSNPLN